ncbi:MAG: hypothetical protein Q8Q09_24235 [Deltaproteobacteria bacterium]|nr:hypothetical protein [Deltaproteobacteria bacterium]
MPSRDSGRLADVVITVEEDVGVLDAARSAPTLAQAMVIAPMHLVPSSDASGADLGVDLTLRADGTIHRRGTLIARIAGERIVDVRGREVLGLAQDRVVTLAGTRTGYRVTAQGELVRPDNVRLVVASDGRVGMLLPNGSEQPLPMRIEGFATGYNVTAVLLCLFQVLQP